MKFFTPSAFADRLEKQISEGIEVPSYFPFVRTEKNIRIRYQMNGKLVKLNTNSPLETAMLYKQFGLIEGYDQHEGELCRMWMFNEVPNGNLTLMVKTTVRWEDIDLSPAVIQAIAARYEWQKQGLSLGLIRRVVVDLFTELFSTDDKQAA